MGKGVILRLFNPKQLRPLGGGCRRRTPMGENSNERVEGKAVEQFDRDTIERTIRERVRDIIEDVVEAELEAVLGAPPSERVGEERKGYRHGHRERTLTTSTGPTTFAMPRARLRKRGGGCHEWQSQTVARYERRSRRVDEAIVGVYLGGVNTRRIRGALAPLLKGAPLSKDAVSRLVGRLKDDFERWHQGDLQADQIRHLYMDGWYPKVRIDKKRVRVPVLVTLGTRATGERVVIDLRIAGEESSAAWGEVITALVKRRIGVPALAVIDGNPGLAPALQAQWKNIQIQRCTNHKLWNLQAKAPARLREELTEDYRRMIYADSVEEVAKQREKFQKKWKLKCAAVLTSLEEAGDDLFTFTHFPPSQWKALRTTNAIERINEEFRRRTKTQASLPNDAAVVLLMYGLLCSGQIRLNRMVGWKDLPQTNRSVVMAEAA
jgi:transposase-like protein